MATDAGASLLRGVEVTTADVHDAAELEAVLPSETEYVYADSAFTGARASQAIRSRGGMRRFAYTHSWGGREARARLEAHTAAVR